MDYYDQIDPELQKAARSMPFNRQIVSVGNIYQALAGRFVKIPKDISVKTIETEGYQRLKVKTEIFTPENVTDPMPALLYVHGGAFCFKAADYHKQLACIYAAKAKCKVFFPDFHLAPKYPYPASLEDVRSLYRYMTDHAAELGIDPDRIGIAGDSSGAALAALVCNSCGKEGLPEPCLQMLIYPLTDADMETPSMRSYTEAPNWGSQNMSLVWKLYIGDQNKEAFEDMEGGVLKEEFKKEALPMHSTLPAEIPDTYIETTEIDCLHDEGILYGRRLEEAGANVEMNDTKGTFHGYDMALDTQIVIRAVKKRIAFLRRHF